MFQNFLKNVMRGRMIEDKLSHLRNVSTFIHGDGFGYEVTMELEDTDERLTIKPFHVDRGEIIYEKGEFVTSMFVARDLFKKILEMFPSERGK